MRERSGALHNAAQMGDFEEVKSLVNTGANVDKKGSVGITPLMYALKGENFKVVKYLVEHGADVNAEDDDGNTVLFLCTVYVDREFDKFFDYLLENGADINARNREGQTLFMRFEGNEEAENWLFSKGANGDAKKFDETLKKN